MPQAGNFPFSCFTCCEDGSLRAPSSPSTFPVIAADMQAVDALIHASLHTGVPLVAEVSQHLIRAGGKRLRPALLLLVAGALDYGGTEHHRLAAVVEFIHTATLLHDDVVDESMLRRGLPTANAHFGNPASVLVGDFLYSRAFQMMVQTHNLRVMQILADATNTIAEGEVLQLTHMGDLDLDEADYLRVIRAKTAPASERAHGSVSPPASRTCRNPEYRHIPPPPAHHATHGRYRRCGRYPRRKAPAASGPPNARACERR